MFIKVYVSSIFNEKKIRRARVGIEPGIHVLTTRPLRIDRLEVIWFELI